MTHSEHSINIYYYFYKIVIEYSIAALGYFNEGPLYFYIG